VVNAGLSLKTASDLQEGNALAADFTAQGWRTHLKMPSTPQLTPAVAGARLAELALDYQFSMFEFWLSDYAGHQQDMAQAVQLLESFDLVMGGLVNTWNDERGLILITSDHGNLEDISTRRHTANPVPALVIGEPAARRAFIEGLNDLTGIAPRILNFFPG
jgi:bisphosphoglycerate-independent phosphoglycerate mutase (AlkP superfamily)